MSSKKLVNEAIGLAIKNAKLVRNMHPTVIARAKAAEEAARQAKSALLDYIDGQDAKIEQMRTALEQAVPILQEASQPYNGYGYFPGGDPRNFFPDPECSTDKEREDHKAACDAWDAQQKSEPESPAGEWTGNIHLLHGKYGLGSYSIPPEAKYAEALEAALVALKEEGNAGTDV